jgi:hypothetical protein
MATLNSNPATIFSKKVILSTINEDTNASVTEGYFVSNPQGAGIQFTTLASGNKVIIPLTNTSGAGSPVLKIHYPGQGNTLYVTFAVQNSVMADGYYDYKTGIPSSYKTALRNWINTNPTTGLQYAIPTAPVTRIRKIQFSAYGLDTNKPQEAVTFYVSFKSVFGSLVVPSESISTSTVSGPFSSSSGPSVTTTSTETVSR